MTNLLRAARRARGPRPARDDGFTLVEVIVSLAILVIAVVGLLTALVVTLQATTLGRANQQAGDVANAELEKIRSYDYAQVTLAAGDPTMLGTSTYEGEPVAVAAGGAVQPALTSFVADNRTYAIRRWVTDSETNAAGAVTVRRVTVEVEFEANGIEHTRLASTLVTNTRRGLPLPNFTFKYFGAAPLVAGRPTISVAPGSDADLGLVLRNLGARDTWNLTASQVGWTFYVDTNRNGIRDTGEPLAADTDSSGSPDTGAIEPSAAPVYLVAHRTVSGTGLTTVTFTATSSAQPAVGAKSVETGVNITTVAATPTPAPSPTSTTPGPTCTGGTPVLADVSAPPPSYTGGGYSTLTLTLQNGAAGDTMSRPLMALSRDSTTQVSTCNFSTEVPGNTAGRHVPLLTEARWDYTPAGGSAKDRDFRGTAVLKIWVKCPSGTTPTITATFGLKTTVTHAATGSTTVAASGCNSSKFTAVPIQVAGATFNSAGSTVQVRLRANQPVTLLYDAPGAGATFAVGAK